MYSGGTRLIACTLNRYTESMTTAFITGANKGIGRAIAENLGGRGYQVLIGARNEERGRRAVEELRAMGLAAQVVHIDMSSLTSVDEAAAYVREEYGDLELLVNNAATPGYPMHAPGWAFEARELERIWRTDFLGPFELVKSLMDVLARNHGRIVNVTIPIEPSPRFNTFAYQTSKAPLNVMTKSLGIAFAEEGFPIEIFAVTPGGTSTDLNGHIEGPYVKTPEQAASVIVDFLFDGQNHNGTVINYDSRTWGYAADAH